MAAENILERLVMAGLGLISKGKSEVEKAVKKAVKEGKIGKKEGEKLVKNLTKKIDQQKKDIEKIVEQQVSKALSTLGIVSAKDLKEISNRIEKLEAKAARRTVAKKVVKKVVPKEETANV